MGRPKTAVSFGRRNDEIFLAGVEYLSKKYKIDGFTLITKDMYHIDAETDAEMDMKKELVKIFQK